METNSSIEEKLTLPANRVYYREGNSVNDVRVSRETWEIANEAMEASKVVLDACTNSTKMIRKGKGKPKAILATSAKQQTPEEKQKGLEDRVELIAKQLVPQIVSFLKKSKGRFGGTNNIFEKLAYISEKGQVETMSGTLKDLQIGWQGWKYGESGTKPDKNDPQHHFYYALVQKIEKELNEYLAEHLHLAMESGTSFWDKHKICITDPGYPKDGSQIITITITSRIKNDTDHESLTEKEKTFDKTNSKGWID